MPSTTQRCCACGGDRNVVREWREKGTTRPCCDLCHFYRSKLSLQNFKDKASRIHAHRAHPYRAVSQTLCAPVSPTVWSKRRNSMRKNDIRRGCDPNKTMSQTELRAFVKGKLCYLCGACPTGLDRLHTDTCYQAQNMQHQMKPCCYHCNRMRRDTQLKTFVTHMNRVHANK